MLIYSATWPTWPILRTLFPHVEPPHKPEASVGRNYIPGDVVFTFQVFCFGPRAQNFGFRVCCYGLRVHGFGFRFQVLGTRYQVAG